MKQEITAPSVIGIGNALVDVINVLEDDGLLHELGLLRGSMTLVDDLLSKKIYELTRNNKREISTGGSAANTIHALAALGAGCGYIGKIGDDILGNNFKDEFEKKNITTHLLISHKDTGRVMSLVSPDSERTMATYLGAAADLKPEELRAEMFEGHSILYMEGYLLQDHKLVNNAIDLARKSGLNIALDLASYNVVEDHLGFLKKLIPEKVNIVFANEDEAFAFTGKQPEGAVTEMASMCEIAVVKMGKSGSLIQRDKEIVRAGIFSANAIDTTGAGDSYAAGFLYGLLNGYTLNLCSQIAALVSARVVEVMGAKISDIQWHEIKASIKKMVQNNP